MALGEAILVCLIDEPMTGYDVAKAFETSIGFFWTASHQQIYRELGRLKEKGFVEVREVVQTGKPNRLVYSITAQGRAALRAWSALVGNPPAIRDDMLVRFYALEHIDARALREEAALRLDHHRSRAERYQKIRDRHFSGANLDRGATGRLLALDLGLLYERGWAQWCERALDVLSAVSNENVTPIRKAKELKK